MNFDTAINNIMISFRLKNNNKINLSFEIKNIYIYIGKFYNITTEKAVAAFFLFSLLLCCCIYIFARRTVKVCSKVHKLIYRNI